MRYKINFTRTFETEIIEANTEAEAYERLKMGKVKESPIGERVITGISEFGVVDDKPICNIDESYFKSDLNLTRVANSVFFCLADHAKEGEKTAKEFYDIFEERYIANKENPMTVSEVFDLIDEYVTLRPKECREAYDKR